MESATRGTDETDSNTVGLSVGGVDAEIGLSNRVKKTTKTGKGGKLEETKVVGSAGAGGSIGVGDTRIGDSVENVADATIDGQGNANVKLTKTKKATDWSKLAKAKLPFMGDDKGEDGKKKPAKGAAGDGDRRQGRGRHRRPQGLRPDAVEQGPRRDRQDRQRQQAPLGQGRR